MKLTQNNKPKAQGNKASDQPKKLDKPASRGGRPAAQADSRSGKPGADFKKFDKRSERPAASDKPAGRGGRPAASSDKPAGRGGRPAASSDKPASRAGRPAASSDKPAGRAGRPAASSDKPAGRAGRPAASSDSRAGKSSYQGDKSEPKIDYRKSRGQAGAYSSATKPKKRQPKPEAKQTHAEIQTRLNKAISETGHCSRREADVLIDAGKVKVNNRPVVMGQYVYPKDRIEVDGVLLKRAVKHIYMALNKPEGIECTTDPRVKGNIVDFMKYKQRIYPVGRLDKASDGLLLLTNDGDIVNKILRAGNAHEKEYLVSVDRPVTPQFLERMRKGVPILDTVTKPCKINQEGERVFRIILTQGLNRQIRRMCEALGYEVKKLSRIRIMHIHLGDLPVGKWRHLTSKELEQMMKAIENSISDQIASYGE